jgi:hypothetical protein
MTFLGLSEKQKNQLEFEVVPTRARLQLTRMLRHAVKSDDGNTTIARMNTVINICRHVIGSSISIIEANDFGDYEFVDSGWIRAELEVSMRRPDTPELVETLADLIQEGWLEGARVNEVLAPYSCSFYLDRVDQSVIVEITPIEELDAEDDDNVVSIRVLVRRMESALQQDDYSNVLHASASIFETLAKDIVAIEGVQDQPLGAFFNRYRKDSLLPSPLIDFIYEVYKRRGFEPLAGHGHLDSPSITREEAIVLSEMTKAFVRIERQLSHVQVNKIIKNDKE